VLIGLGIAVVVLLVVIAVELYILIEHGIGAIITKIADATNHITQLLPRK